jgi:hypothetical protein
LVQDARSPRPYPGADGLFGATATYTRTLSGHVHGTNSAGTVRTAYSCTTDDQAWTALRDAQGTQTSPPPPADPELGTIVWLGGADLPPDTLYERLKTGAWPHSITAA